MTTKNNFGILGYGYVGKATHFGLLKNESAIVHDQIFKSNRSDLLKADTVFICIPTSTQKDIKTLFDEIQFLTEGNKDCQIVVRSTLPIGTCRQIEQNLGIKILYIPEFLRERYWEEDCLRRPLIIGSDNLDIPSWLKNDDHVQCSLEEAEIVKMFSNNFAVVRIAFANLFYDVSQKYDANYDLIKQMFFKVAHNQTYMEVPGHDGTRGFGGKCLPKDLDFMIDTLDQNQLASSWLKNIKELNKQWQEKF